MMQNGEGLIYSSLGSLLKQRAQAQLLQRGSKNVHARQTGQHLSFHKGRGMDFAESRLYQPGDDVRLLDWRVTARTGKAHTKVFQEERERPVLVWIDMGSTMFFATRGRFKSVVCAEVASTLIWKSWLDGDRVGGFILQADGLAEFQPGRSLSGLSRLMHELAVSTQPRERQRLPAKTALSMADSLVRLRHISAAGTQIILCSDFRGLDSAAEQQILALSRHASLNFIQITDPFEWELPEIHRFKITDGLHFFSFNRRNKKATAHYQQQVSQRQQILQQICRKTHASLTGISTTDDKTTQLVKLSRGLK